MPRSNDYTRDDWTIVNPPLRTLDEELDEGFKRMKCETGDARFDRFSLSSVFNRPAVLVRFVCGDVLPIARFALRNWAPNAAGLPLGSSAIVRLGVACPSTPVV